MALIRILVDGYSLLHNWPELAPGKARHSAAARDELVQILTQYHDATGMPITVFFDGSRPRSARPDGESAAAVEVLFSKAGQTADQMIERAAHRFNAYGEILAVTDDIAERDTVISLGGMASTCRNFIHELEHTLRDLHADIQHHNHKERTRFRRTSKLLVLVVLLGGALWTEGLFGQTNTAASRENRWLFVVQTSASMRPRTAAIQEIASRMLLSGMNGQMQRGDTLGVWTYNETLHTGLFPLQRWTPEASKDIARGVFEFLKAQPYEKEGGYKVISESLEQIVGDSAVLTVIWISDGRQKILYSPFDDKINAIHEAWVKQQEKANLPLITALRAVRGRLTNYTVTVPPFAFELPPLPPELNLAEATKAKPEPVQPPPQPVPSLILSGKQPEHPPSDANSAEVAAEPATGTPKPVLPQGTTKISSEAKPVQPTRVESNAPVPSLGSDQANPSLPSPVQAADTRPQQPFLTVGKSLVIAILFAILVLGIVLGLLLRSRRSSRISLITRSLDREQK